MYASGWQTLLPGVRDEILNWAGLREAKFIDAFANKQTALFSKYWDEKANALVQDWSHGTPEKADHTDYFLWVHCPYFCCNNQLRKFYLITTGASCCCLSRKTSPGFGRWGKLRLTGGILIPASQYTVIIVALYTSSLPSGPPGWSSLMLWG